MIGIIYNRTLYYSKRGFPFDGLLPKYANKYLLIGFDRNSNLLEIMYNIRKDGSYNVFHAMRCRKEFYHYVEENNGYV